MAVINLFRQSFRFDNYFFTAFSLFIYLLKFKMLIKCPYLYRKGIQKKVAQCGKKWEKPTIFVP